MIYDSSIFRAYDIRGTYPNQINESVAYAAGQAYVSVMKPKTVAVGRDVRLSGESLQQALIRGITDAGANVILLEGALSTEMLYFAAGTLDCDGGISITASHNPAEWNGIKMVGKGASPLSKDDKLGEIYEVIQSGQSLSEFNKGTVTTKPILDEYAAYLAKYIPTNLPSIKVVANPNFGANGKVVDAVNLPIDLVRLNWNEDGTFPKGTPNPFLPKNRKEIGEVIVAEHADFGVAWDADADRCFLFDEKGRIFHGYYITALLIEQYLKLQPSSNVVIEPRLIWATQDAALNNGGTPYMSRVGHAFIKMVMREKDCVFGGESSGHFYFKDFWYCDNGMITFLLMLDAFGKHIASGGKVSELLDTYMEKYPIVLEELNYITTKAPEIIADVTSIYAGATLDTLDGISIEYPEWRFNLRSSNTEPLLRVCIEARSHEELAKREAELRAYMLGQGAELKDDN